MHQITYISTARPGMTEGDIAAILTSSRNNNHRDGITGLLVSDGKRFLQALEGDEALVNAAYTRIKADLRHRATVVLSTKSVSERQFGNWDMAFNRIGSVSENQTLTAFVDRLVAEVKDPDTKALFASFARIRGRHVA
jgi:hypothetical protein